MGINGHLAYVVRFKQRLNRIEVFFLQPVQHNASPVKSIRTLKTCFQVQHNIIIQRIAGIMKVAYPGKVIGDDAFQLLIYFPDDLDVPDASVGHDREFDLRVITGNILWCGVELEQFIRKTRKTSSRRTVPVITEFFLLCHCIAEHTDEQGEILIGTGGRFFYHRRTTGHEEGTQLVTAIPGAGEDKV